MQEFYGSLISSFYYFPGLGTSISSLTSPILNSRDGAHTSLYNVYVFVTSPLLRKWRRLTYSVVGLSIRCGVHYRAYSLLGRLQWRPCTLSSRTSQTSASSGMKWSILLKHHVLLSQSSRRNARLPSQTGSIPSYLTLQCTIAVSVMRTSQVNYLQKIQISDVKCTRDDPLKLETKPGWIGDNRKFFFLHRVLRRWNSLDQVMVDAPSIKGRQIGLNYKTITVR